MKRLETVIREFLAPFPPETRFKVKAFELCREDYGWSVNDAWYLERDADLETVLESARGRWEVFKVNYLPRAKVSDLTDIGYDLANYGVNLECECTAFLEIIPTEPVPFLIGE